jgi:O-antigen/teichoic acid export membrane protein
VTEVRLDDEQEDEQLPAPGGVAALARDAFIYGATRVLFKSLAFLLVPLYAHFLSPSDFGVLELVLASVAFVDVLITANMDGVLARFYFDRDERPWRRQIITLYLVIEAGYPLIVVGGLIAFSHTISDHLLGSSAYALFLVIALVDVYLSNIVDLPLILCRLRRKPVTFAAYSLARGLVQVVLTVIFVAVLELGVKGIVLASLIAAGVAFVLTLREYVRDLTRDLDWHVGREMVAFAWPGIIGGLAFYALNLVDRFIVRHYHGTADTGLYGAAFRYSQIVLVAVIAFRLGWTQWHYSWLRTGRHPQMVARGAVYYFFVTGLLTVLVSAWILPAFHVLMPERYWEATHAVAPLCLAALATGAYTVFAVGFNVTKRMRRLPLLTLVGAGLAVLLYFVLIPPYSFVGAAWATAAAFSFLALLVMAVGQRLYPVPWDWRRIGLAFGAAAGLAVAALAVDEAVPFRLSLPVRLGLTVAYPLGLFALGFFPADDLARAWARARTLRPRI